MAISWKNRDNLKKQRDNTLKSTTTRCWILNWLSKTKKRKKSYSKFASILHAPCHLPQSGNRKAVLQGRLATLSISSFFYTFWHTQLTWTWTYQISSTLLHSSHLSCIGGRWTKSKESFNCSFAMKSRWAWYLSSFSLWWAVICVCFWTYSVFFGLLSIRWTGSLTY